MDIKICLLLLVILLCLFPVKEGLFIEDWASVDFSIESNDKGKQHHYEELMKQFDSIFPTHNRNAGGPQFYHYIHSHKGNLTKDKFLFCFKFS